jgi:hypothetical protein
MDGAVLKQCFWFKGWVVTMNKLVTFHSLLIYNCKCLINNFKNENHTLLGYYAISSGNFLPMFQDKLSVGLIVKKSKFLTLEDRADRLSYNIGKKLPLLAA